MSFIYNEHLISPKSVSCTDISIHSKCLNHHHLLKYIELFTAKSLQTKLRADPRLGCFMATSSVKEKERQANDHTQDNISRSCLSMSYITHISGTKTPLSLLLSCHVVIGDFSKLWRNCFGILNQYANILSVRNLKDS